MPWKRKVLGLENAFFFIGRAFAAESFSANTTARAGSLPRAGGWVIVAVRRAGIMFFQGWRNRGSPRGTAALWSGSRKIKQAEDDEEEFFLFIYFYFLSK